MWVLVNLQGGPFAAVLHITPARPLAESLQYKATAQGSADHSISSFLLIRKYRRQHLGDILHRCAGINAPQVTYRCALRMQPWARALYRDYKCPRFGSPWLQHTGRVVRRHVLSAAAGMCRLDLLILGSASQTMTLCRSRCCVCSQRSCQAGEPAMVCRAGA